MKALSLTQPWAWSMVHGPKRIENRRWPAPHAMIGQSFAFHASMKWDRDGELFLLEKGVLIPPRHICVQGMLIGVTELVRCIDKAHYDAQSEERKRELLPDPEQEQFFFGPYGFLTQNTRPITPIPYPGSLSFFELTPEVTAEVLQRATETADHLPAPIITPAQGSLWEPPGGLQKRPDKPRKRGRK